GGRILRNAGARGEEAGDEIEAGVVGRRRDDDAAGGHGGQPREIGRQRAHARGALDLDEPVEAVATRPLRNGAERRGERRRRFGDARRLGREIELDPAVTTGGGEYAAA